MKRLCIWNTGLPGVPEQIEDFLREVRCRAVLDHPHIARLHEASSCPQGLYFVSEYVPGISAAKIVIDTTGLGAGLYDRLRELMGDEMIEPVNFGSKAYDHEHYVNRRAEIWDQMRQWLDDPAGVQVPDTDEFQGDVCSLIRGPGATRFNSNGQLILEPKDHVKERLTFSPDIGDAAALTFAVEINTRPDDKPEPAQQSRDGAWLGM